MIGHVRPSMASRMVAALALSAAALPCTGGSIARQTQRLPEIAAPAGGEGVWVARAMRLNGVPMTIKRFTSSTNADEVLHQYEHKLRTRSDMKTRRSQDGAWRILAVMTDDYYATIRARNTIRGTEGTITVTPPLADARPAKRTSFPHPSTARVVSLQEYDDAGVEAEHVSLVSRRSVTLEAGAFVTLLSRQGWQVLRSEAAQRRNGHVIEAQNGAALAFIHLRRSEHDGLTTILIVWRKA